MFRDKKNIIKNMDGIPVIDKKTGEFLLNFSERQRNALNFFIERGLSITPFAYENVPAEFMELIIFSLYTHGEANSANISDVDLWKAVHADIDASQFRYCLQAMGNKVYILDELDDIHKYDGQIFKYIAIGSTCKKNFCKKVRSGISIYDLKEEVLLCQAKYIKKEQKKERLEMFMHRHFR